MDVFKGKLQKLIFGAQSLRKKATQSKSPDLWDQCKTARNLINKEKRQLKTQEIAKTIKKAVNYSKAACSCSNKDIGRQKSQLKIQRLNSNGIVLDSDKTIGNGLAEAFVIPSKSSLVESSCDQEYPRSLETFKIQEEDVHDVISHLDEGKV